MYYVWLGAFKFPHINACRVNSNTPKSIQFNGCKTNLSIITGKMEGSVLSETPLKLVGMEINRFS